MFPKIFVTLALASSFLSLVAGQGLATGEPCDVGSNCATGTCDFRDNQVLTAECLDLNADQNNCGSVGTVCGSNSSCVQGQCRAPCGSEPFCMTGETCVSSGVTAQCVNFSNDVNNCGSSGNVCRTAPNGTASCAAGSCSFACNTGFTVDIEGQCIANAPAPNPSARARATRMGRDLPKWF